MSTTLRQVQDYNAGTKTIVNDTQVDKGCVTGKRYDGLEATTKLKFF